MPDGFDPHRELARISTLRETITACRERTPLILQRIDEMLNNDELAQQFPAVMLKVCEFAYDRAWGKPINQHRVDVHTDKDDRVNPVKITMPDNGRQSSLLGRIIDVDQESNE
jgi:hypothetical protein